MDITHACHLLYIQIARQSFLLADQERRTGGASRLHIAPPSATVTSGSVTELGTSDMGGPTFSQEQEGLIRSKSDTELASALNVPRAAPPSVNFDSEDSNVTSPGLMMLRLVNNYQFS